MSAYRTVRKRSFHPALLFVGLFVLLAAAAGVELFWQVKGLTFDNWRTLFAARGADNLIGYTVWSIRLPRVLLSIIAGAALAVAGCLLQGITRNALADPEVMGINQSASLFVVSALLLLGHADVPLLIIGAALAGALAGGSIIYALSLYRKVTPIRIVLAGISVSFFFGSMTTGLIVMNEMTLMDIIYWMTGKLSGAEWSDIQLGTVVIVPALLLAWLLGSQLNVLQLDDEIAVGIGQKVTMIRRGAMLLAALLIGASVALCGPIGFVGLMVPHMARKLLGHDYRITVPLSAVMGAVLMLLSDLAGQFVFYPAEMPVGIVTALLGTPFFLVLIRRRKAALL